MAAAEGQQHPLKIYWIMWGALFVLSAMSYATDFMDDGALRTFCILLFMMLKAGGIVYIFMHMGWERLALKLAILGPPVAILVLIWLMSYEGFYTEDTRVEYYGESTFEPQAPPHH
jgi:caa(3)-type oxidase subunit IV